MQAPSKDAWHRHDIFHKLTAKYSDAQRHPNWTSGQVDIVFSSVILFFFYVCCRLLQVKTVNIYKENENKKIRF